MSKKNDVTVSCFIRETDTIRVRPDTEGAWVQVQRGNEEVLDLFLTPADTRRLRKALKRIEKGEA